MSLNILGIGTALPPFAATRDEARDSAPLFCSINEQEERLLSVLFRKAGVEKRHLVMLETDQGEPITRQDLFWPARSAEDQGPSTAERMIRYEREAGKLAHQAAIHALTESDVPPESITHLVTVSCSGFHAPGFDVALMKSLPLAPTVSRTHLGFMGCHGAMNGLRVAHAYAASDPSARVLLCAVELCSLHYQYGFSPEKIVTNALFADGAAALVCSMNGSAGLRLRRSGSVVMPDAEEAMTWRIGDHGFKMTLSASVPDLISKHLPSWLTGWLTEAGLSLADVPNWAVHPGGPRILQAVGEALGLERSALDVSKSILAECGNMSSPTILFVLKRMLEGGAMGPGVALGFGPGLTAEAMLVDFGHE